MKSIFIYIALTLLILGGGLVYLNMGNNSANPFHKSEAGSPTVTTNSDNTDKLVFHNYGAAPELTSAAKWFNSDPQTLKNLQGQVVLINFWTYSCYSCIQALPYLNQWWQTYKDQGFTIIGVHTPEYSFEKVSENLQTAISRYNIGYPVAQDNSYAMWNAYNNQFWPAIYLIDREGKIVYTRFGDGKYDLTENAIKQLVDLPGGLALNDDATTTLNIKPSQKLQFGLKHSDVLSSNEQVSKDEQVYTLPEIMRRNSYALEGVWKLSNDTASLTQGFGRIRLSFSGSKVQLDAQSIKSVKITIKIDGKQQTPVEVQDQKNYLLFQNQTAGKHTIDIEIPQPGFQATAFIVD